MKGAPSGLHSPGQVVPALQAPLTSQQLKVCRQKKDGSGAWGLALPQRGMSTPTAHTPTLHSPASRGSSGAGVPVGSLPQACMKCPLRNRAAHWGGVRNAALCLSMSTVRATPPKPGRRSPAPGAPPRSASCFGSGHQGTPPGSLPPFRSRGTEEAVENAPRSGGAASKLAFGVTTSRPSSDVRAPCPDLSGPWHWLVDCPALSPPPAHLFRAPTPLSTTPHTEVQFRLRWGEHARSQASGPRLSWMAGEGNLGFQGLRWGEKWPEVAPRYPHSQPSPPQALPAFPCPP